MFSKLFGRKDSAPASALPAIRNVTLGRTVWLDTLAWRRLGEDLRFPLDRDTLEITAQGLVELRDGGFVHRFYTDDNVMFQAVSDDRDGQRVNDITVFVPWDSAYPGSQADIDAWQRRLKARTFTGPDLPDYHRLWFGDEAESQEPVTFWEELHDDRDGVPDRRIFQTCMLFARDLPGDGRELLLAIQQENENEDTRRRETSFEIMIGVALGVGEFRA
ncbi:MAG: YjfK family protein [Caulobacter sp.]|nr:YjfK family protein [Caulobacter sp.]